MSNKRLRWIACITILIFITGLTIALGIRLGSVNMPIKDIASTITSYIAHGYSGDQNAVILFKIRIPRVFLGFMIGGALSLAGIILQGLFRNPLVEPFTLGISGGAGLAVSLTVVFFKGGAISLPIAGFVGALCAIICIYMIGRKCRTMDVTGFLLSGIMFSFICSSLMMLVMSISKSDEAHSILFWLMGNLERTDPLFMRIVFVTIFVGACLTFTKSWKLNGLSQGEEQAYYLGIDVDKEKKFLFVLASLMTGVCVSVSGIIGFVGLVVPHFMRLIIGSDHRILIPASFLCGGIFLVLCDSIARTVLAPIELPVGVITGVVGGAVFLVFFIKGAKKI